MSARLIKRDHQNGVETLVLGGAGESSVVSSPFEVMKPAPARSNEDEANRIVEQAMEKAAAIEREARENARQFLDAELNAEIAKTIDPWRERLAQSLDELDGLRAAITADAERELVRLALEIARKVVHREVTIDHEIVMTLARLGLSRAHTRVNATIHLHYDDLEYVNSNRRRLNATQALELVQDRSVSRGGCLIHTEMGDVDARIEQQFEEIERAFLG